MRLKRDFVHILEIFSPNKTFVLQLSLWNTDFIKLTKARPIIPLVLMNMIIDSNQNSDYSTVQLYPLSGPARFRIVFLNSSNFGLLFKPTNCFSYDITSSLYCLINQLGLLSDFKLAVSMDNLFGYKFKSYFL